MSWRNGKSVPFGLCIHSHSDFSLKRSEEDSGKDTMGLSGSKKKKKKKVEVNKYERTIRMAELLMLVNHLGNRFTKDTEAWKYFSSMDEQNRAVRRTQKIHHHIIHTNMYTSGVRLV